MEHTQSLNLYAQCLGSLASHLSNVLVVQEFTWSGYVNNICFYIKLTSDCFNL